MANQTLKLCLLCWQKRRNGHHEKKCAYKDETEWQTLYRLINYSNTFFPSISLGFYTFIVGSGEHTTVGRLLYIVSVVSPKLLGHPKY